MTKTENGHTLSIFISGELIKDLKSLVGFDAEFEAQVKKIIEREYPSSKR